MTTRTSKVKDFELVDHGIEGSQYFQGCGVAFTPFSDVATGCGSNPAEAIEDALEQVAQGTDNVDTEDLERRILESEGWKKFPSRPRVKASADDTYYYVSIRYNVAESGRWTIRRFTLERFKRVNGYIVPYAYDASWPHPVKDCEEWFADDLPALASYIGESAETLADWFCSDDPEQRARAYQAIGDYHGWDNLDDDPLVITDRTEIEARYAADGPLKTIANLGDANPIDYGGYFIYEDSNGEFSAEYLEVDENTD